MSRKVELPEEIFEALGPEPERSVLEAVLLLLVFEGEMSVVRAGELLGLDRRSAGTHREASTTRIYPGRTWPTSCATSKDTLRPARLRNGA